MLSYVIMHAVRLLVNRRYLLRGIFLCPVLSGLFFCRKPWCGMDSALPAPNLPHCSESGFSPFFMGIPALLTSFGLSS